jgi:arylsulfatase A-like enzyme
LAHAFQQAGFKTGMTGKWHLSSTVETETKGFTYQDAANSPQPMAAEVAEVQAAGFDDVFALYPINMKDSGFSWFSHNPEFQAVVAMDWWDANRAKGHGRFLYFAFTLPHMPK